MPSTSRDSVIAGSSRGVSPAMRKQNKPPERKERWAVERARHAALLFLHRRVLERSVAKNSPTTHPVATPPHTAAYKTGFPSCPHPRQWKKKKKGVPLFFLHQVALLGASYYCNHEHHATRDPHRYHHSAVCSGGSRRCADRPSTGNQLRKQLNPFRHQVLTDTQQQSLLQLLR
ncbi:hypothetical protein MRX96_029572 [Rhipicephalus microplus]